MNYPNNTYFSIITFLSLLDAGLPKEVKEKLHTNEQLINTLQTQLRETLSQKHEETLTLVEEAIQTTPLSEESYRDAISRPIASKSIKDLICQRLYPVVKTDKESLLNVRRQFQTLKDEHLHLQSQYQEKETALHNIEFQYDKRKDDIEYTISKYEQKMESLHQKYISSQEQISTLKDKGKKFDALARRCNEQEKTIEKLQQDNKLASKTLSSVARKDQSNTQEIEAMSSEVIGLRADMKYLSRECESLQDMVSKKDKELLSLRKLLEDTRQSRDTLSLELGQSVTNLTKAEKMAREEAEEKARQSEQQLESRFERERSAWEASLSAARDEAKESRRELELYRKEVRIEETSLKTREDEARAHALQASNSAAEARAELRNKVVEVERLRASEEKLQFDLEKASIAREAESLKVKAIHEEYSTLRVKYDSEIADYQRKEQILRDKLATYLVLEHNHELGTINAGIDVALQKPSREMFDINQVLNSNSSNPKFEMPIPTKQTQNETNLSEYDQTSKSYVLAQKLVEKHNVIELLRKELTQQKVIIRRLEVEIEQRNGEQKLLHSAEKKGPPNETHQISDEVAYQRETSIALSRKNQDFEVLVETLRTRCALIEMRWKDEQKIHETTKNMFQKQIQKLLHQQQTSSETSTILKTLLTSMLKKFATSMSSQEISDIRSALRSLAEQKAKNSLHEDGNKNSLKHQEDVIKPGSNISDMVDMALTISKLQTLDKSGAKKNQNVPSTTK